MKRIIISLTLFSIICCNAYSCDRETNQDKCYDYIIDDYEGFSCYKFNYENENEKGCCSFPDDPNSQKVFFNLLNGMQKEFYSGTPDYFDEEDKNIDFYVGNKDSYNKGEEIVLKGIPFPDEEKKNLKARKTCTYLYYWRYYDRLEETFSQGKQYEGYPNIEDKNLCFNAEQISELKDLIDCGYADIKYISNGKEYNIKTCFYIPNEKMPEKLAEYFKTNVIDFSFQTIIYDLIIDSEDYYRNITSNFEDSRKLSTNSYELIVEDKYGRKIKYTNDKSKGEEIENSSKLLNLNIIFLLFFILLFK